MDRVRLLAAAVVAGYALFGWYSMAPSPEPTVRPHLEIRLTRCEMHGDACPDARPWVEPERRLARLSAGGHFYGECGGLISAVFLDPEPCDRPAKPIRQASLPSPR